VVDTLRSDYGGHGTQLFGELGWRLDGSAGVALEPFASLAWVNLRNRAGTERGGVAALAMAGGSNQVALSTLGLRASTTLDVGARTTARGMLGWRHTAGDRAPQTGMTLGGAGRFVVAGVPLARNAAVLEAGLDITLQSNLTLGLSYAGQVSGSVKEHGLRAMLALEF